MAPRLLSLVELDNYNVIPRELAEKARIVRVPVLPPGAAGMTILNWIFVKRDDRRAGNRELLVHELVHVRQWRELGVVGFLSAYLSSYVLGLSRHRNHRQAYLDIPLEVEAREIAAEWRAARLRSATPKLDS